MTRYHPSSLYPVLVPALLALLGTPAARGGGLPEPGSERPLIYLSGAGAGRDGGDWVSARDGLDAAYRFGIEVPTGQRALVIELFDADVLMGAVAVGPEPDLMRGADRGDTKVRYELYDPRGRRAATRFVTADESSPAGSNNAWTSFFDSRTAVAGGAAADRFADDFEQASYGNDDGGRAFAGPWVESGDLGGGGAVAGDLRVAGGELVISNRSDVEPWANRPGVERQLDLGGYRAAELRFDFTTGPGVDFEDSLLVEVSADGGVTWDVLEELIGLVGAASGRRAYDLGSRLADRTRIRFRVGRFYAGPEESFRVDNLEVRAVAELEPGAPQPGHWLLVADASSRLNRDAGSDSGADEDGDDVNALGLRAHDGDPGPGGAELNVYAESFLPLGTHGRPGGRAAYALYPYVTAGCGAAVHDFDWDERSGEPAAGQVLGTLELASRTGSDVLTAAALSADDVWNRSELRWTGESVAEVGIRSLAASIADPGPGNFGTLRVGPSAGGEESFRLYLPADGGGVPPKPSLAQSVAAVPDPSATGAAGRYAVTLRLAHPAAAAGSLVFGPEHAVSATVPGGRVRFAAVAEVSAGSVAAEPGGTEGGGEIRWSPGTLEPGAVERLVYHVDIALLQAGGGEVAVTGGPGAGGTRAVFLDETGQSATLGELCPLTVSLAVEALAAEALAAEILSGREASKKIAEVSALPLPANDLPAPAAEPPVLAPDEPEAREVRQVRPSDRSDSPGPTAPPHAESPGIAIADPTTLPVPSSATPPAPSPDYRLGVGDAVRVEVFEDPSLSGDFTVTSDGALVFPLLGEVAVRDLTASEVQKRLAELLERDYIYNPHVSVTVTAYRSKRVQIQGMVRMPGIYYLEGPMRLFDLLSRAQGLLQAPGEIRAGQVARIVRSQTGETVNVDLHELLVLGHDGLNVELLDGDVVYVLRTEEIHVIGEVKKPGSLPYESGMTVLKALSLAGGATKRGSVKQALVRRIQDGEEVQVRVSVEDLLLPDDILEIPLSFW